MSDAFFISPEGDTIAVEADQAPAFAQARGYLPASPDQIKAYQQTAKYGSGGQQALTGIEGAAKGLTAGLSTVVERGMGVPAEDIAGRAAENPVTHTASEIAGTVGGLAIPVSGPGLIAKAGGAVTKALTREGGSVLARIGTKALASGAGSAVEGAFYGAGQVVSEAALGDPKLTAESALATVGLSAALGGLLGAGIGAGEAALPAALAKAREGAQALVAKAKMAYPAVAERLGAAPATTVAEMIAGHAQAMTPEARSSLASEVAKSLQEQNSAVDKALRLANKEFRPAEVEALLPGNSTAKLPDRAAVYEQMIGETDPAKAADLANLLKQIDAPASLTPAQTEARRLAFRIDSAARSMRQAPEAYPGMYPNKLEVIAEGLRRDALNAEPAVVYKAINEAKQNIDPLAKFGLTTGPEHRDAINAIKGVRGQIKASLEDGGVWGQAAGRQAEFNAAQNEYLTAKRNYEAAFGTKTILKTGAVDRPTTAGKVNTWLNQLGTPQGEIRAQALDAMQSAQKNLLDQIEKSAAAAPAKQFDRKSIDSLVNKTGDQIAAARQQAAGAKAVAAIQPVGHPMAGSAAAMLGTAIGGPVMGAAAGAAVAVHRFLGDPTKAVAALGALERMVNAVDRQIATGAANLVKAGPLVERSAAPALKAADVTRLANNPQEMMAKLEKQSAVLHDHAPQTAQALGATSSRAVAFLASKVPQNSPAGPLSPRPEMSPAQIAKFARYQEAVERPQVLLEHARAGTLTQETVEAVAAVYPALMAKMRQAVTDAIAAHPDSIPYQSRQAISLILGQDVDGSLQLTPRIQAAYARTKGGAAGGSPPMPKHAPQAPNRYMTDMQKSANRR